MSGMEAPPSARVPGIVIDLGHRDDARSSFRTKDVMTETSQPPGAR